MEHIPRPSPVPHPPPFLRREREQTFFIHSPPKINFPRPLNNLQPTPRAISAPPMLFLTMEDNFTLGGFFMTNEKQIDANRRNAQRSTGPKTPEGKARSARNALKHGLRSTLTVVPGESREEFEILYDALRDDYQPTDTVEEILVRQIATAEWRLQRIARLETTLIWREMNYQAPFNANARPAPNAPHPLQEPGDADTYLQACAFSCLIVTSDRLSPFARYEASIRNSLYKAINTLEARRRRHQQQPQQEINQTKPISPQGIDNKPLTAPEPLPAQPAVPADPDPGRRKAS